MRSCYGLQIKIYKYEKRLFERDRDITQIQLEISNFFNFL